VTEIVWVINVVFRGPVTMIPVRTVVTGSTDVAFDVTAALGPSATVEVLAAGSGIERCEPMATCYGGMWKCSSVNHLCDGLR
jgi:hypothetical protein